VTCPVVIRAAEQWSRWSYLNDRTLLKSEGSENRSRLSGHGNRLPPTLKYGFIFLALCLLLSDTFRLVTSPNSRPEVSPRTQPARSARTVHGVPHARIMHAKRHPGV
jgi:hypothetical protein